MSKIFALPAILLLVLSGCNKQPGANRYSESDLIGHWDLKFVDSSWDGGETWSRSAAAKDFLELKPDGRGAYGDPTEIRTRVDDVVWSLIGDSLFYYSPYWAPTDGKTKARIVRCDADTLIFEEGSFRYVYAKRK